MNLAESTPPPAVSGKQDPYVGKTIDGRYVVEAALGEGGMGVVYRGRHKGIDKRVAIKVLRGDLAKDAEITERFLQEARAASAIGNPHIVDISDSGELPDGPKYFVMEFLQGKSLTELLKEGRMGVPRLCHIAKQIAQGLSAAHAAQIIHRDLKPDNVMLIARGAEKDFVKILDFGIAKVGSAATKMTRAGSVFGTPHYMSPEQAAGATVDSRTDIYALGVILYEMASGKVPFDADNFMGILTQHMYKAPVPIRALVPEVQVPAGLDAIILKCLTKKPEGRYATMDQLILDLEKLESGVMPDAVQEMMARSGGFNVPADYFRVSAMPAPVPATPAGIPGRKRWPLYAAMAAGGAIVGVVLIAIIVGGGSKNNSVTAASADTKAQPASSPTPIASPSPAVSTAPPVVTKTSVLVVEPLDATVKQGDKDLGAVPVTIELADGDSAQLDISHDGYKPLTVTLKSGEKKTVKLTKLPAVVLPGGKNPGGTKPPADPDDPFLKRKTGH